MIRMYPKAVVLTAHHPFGGTEMMAQSLAFALNANGYDARILNINDTSLQALPGCLQDPDLALVMTTGTLPLGVTVDARPVWAALPPGADFIVYIIDAWPYDKVRVPALREYLAAWHTSPRLHLASLEGTDARLIGPRAHHMPTGAYPARWRTGPKRHPDRIVLWASAHKELAVTRIYSDFEQTLAENNPWGFDGGRIRRIAEALRHARFVHGLSAIADAFGEPLEAVVRDEHLVALAALDSCLKRHRRVKVVMALRDMPVDVYGENWAPYITDSCSMRALVPNPNHNHAFSYICQDYAGLFNFDPNFGDGTNERAVSALAMGVPVANNFNRRTDGVPGVIPYHFSDESIRHAAERLLAWRDPVPTPVDNTWEWRVGGLLRAIAAEAQAASASAAVTSATPATPAGGPLRGLSAVRAALAPAVPNSVHAGPTTVLSA
jgi:hypothetical protein